MLRYLNLRNIILPYPAFRETRYGSIIYRREMLYWYFPNQLCNLLLILPLVSLNHI